MSELHDADARARERALRVDRSFIVQAPAGAGKTELLIRRFLALLATVAEPESILAITFTRKAAAEMRERIVRALRAVHEPDPARALHARTLELARAALATDAVRGWNLLEQPGLFENTPLIARHRPLERRNANQLLVVIVLKSQPVGFGNALRQADLAFQFSESCQCCNLVNDY